MEQSKSSTSTNGSYGYSDYNGEAFTNNPDNIPLFGSEKEDVLAPLERLLELSKKYNTSESVELLFQKLKNFDFTNANQNVLIKICQALFVAKGQAIADQKILINNLEVLYYTANIVNNFSRWSFEFSGAKNGEIANERFFSQLYSDGSRVQSASCLRDKDACDQIIPFASIYNFKTLDGNVDKHKIIKEKIVKLNDKHLLIAIIAMQNVAKSDEVMNVIATVCGIVPQERLEFYSITTKANLYIVEHTMRVFGTTITTRFTVDQYAFFQVKKILHEEEIIPLMRLTTLLNRRDFIGFENFFGLSNELFDSFVNLIKR